MLIPSRSTRLIFFYISPPQHLLKAPYAIVDHPISNQPSLGAALSDTKLKPKAGPHIHHTFKKPINQNKTTRGGADLLGNTPTQPLIFSSATVVVLSTASLADVEGVLFAHLAERLSAHAVEYMYSQTDRSSSGSSTDVEFECSLLKG